MLSQSTYTGRKYYREEKVKVFFKDGRRRKQREKWREHFEF